MQGTFLEQKCRLYGTTHCSTGTQESVSWLLNFALGASCKKQLNIFRQQNIKEMTPHLPLVVNGLWLQGLGCYTAKWQKPKRKDRSQFLHFATAHQCIAL